MSHEVIMPALGMTQDTGRIVAWRKQAGDAVAVGDVLLEVETDKTTMEVEAARAGFIAAIAAEAGADVPVGQVIAVITDEKPDEQAIPVTAPAPAPTAKPRAEPAPKPRPAAAAELPVAPAAGRILASPKAKRLAAERGIDLAQLVAAGIPQPFRVADLARRPRPAETPAPIRQATGQVTARVPAAGFLGMCARVDGNGLVVEPKSAIWAAFAARCLRAWSKEQTLVVSLVQAASGLEHHYADPDRCRFSALAAAPSAQAPDLVFYDLTGTRITAVQSSRRNCPVLSIAPEGDSYALTLAFAEDGFPIAAAITFLESFARLMEEPLRLLL